MYIFHRIFTRFCVQRHAHRKRSLTILASKMELDLGKNTTDIELNTSKLLNGFLTCLQAAENSMSNWKYRENSEAVKKRKKEKRKK